MDFSGLISFTSGSFYPPESIEAEVRGLICRLVDAFPEAVLLFEMMTPPLTKRSIQHDTVSKIGAKFKWGIKSGLEMEAFHSGIRFIEEWNYFDYQRERWKWMGCLARIPAFKNRFNNRIVHLCFEASRH